MRIINEFEIMHEYLPGIKDLPRKRNTKVLYFALNIFSYSKITPHIRNILRNVTVLRKKIVEQG
jgi:hypothetical protein